MANKEIRLKIDVIGNAEESLKNIQKSYDDIAKAAETAKKATQGVGGPSASNPTPTTGPDMNLQPGGKYLKKSFRNDKEEMIGLAVAGDKTSESFRTAQQKAGRFKDEMDEVNNRIKYFSQSGGEKAAQGLSESINLIGASAQVAVGSMTLLGMSNEEATKTVAKLASIEAVMNGVKQVTLALQSDSMFMLGMENAKMKVLAFTTSTYSAVVGTSTGALKAFRLALAGTGIGLAVVAVGYLAKAWMDASDEADKYDKKVAQLSDDQIAKAKEVSKSIADEKEKQRLLKIEARRSLGDETGARALEKAYQDEQIAGLEKRKLQTEKDLKKINDEAVKLQIKQKENFEKEQEFRKRAKIAGGGGTSASVTGLSQVEIEKSKELSSVAQRDLILKKQELEDITLKIGNIKMRKENDSIVKKKPETLSAVAPKTFNVYINSLGEIQQVNIMSDKDEKAFEQTLRNTLLSALTTVQASTSR